jgi:hypothetical protein
MEDTAASTFFSTLTVEVLWIIWITLGRDLRADRLRQRLRILRQELGHAPDTMQLAILIDDCSIIADQITLTRLLLSGLIVRRQSGSDIADYGNNRPSPAQLWKTIANYTLPIPAASRVLRVREPWAVLETLVESVRVTKRDS